MNKKNKKMKDYIYIQDLIYNKCYLHTINEKIKELNILRKQLFDLPSRGQESILLDEICQRCSIIINNKLEISYLEGLKKDFKKGIDY